MPWLYRYEAKGIQEYIFATQRLREIAGASALVDGLQDTARQWITELGGTEHVLAAGNGMISFADKAGLEEFARWWPLYCAEAVPGLHMIQAWVSVEKGQPSASDLAALFRRLDAARMQPRVELPEVGPLVLRTGRTGNAAVALGEKKEVLDDATLAKARAFKEDAADPEGLVKRMLRGIREQYPRAQFCFDLEDFPDGYLAVIHADGNGIGKLFVSAQIPFALQREFSGALTKATESAARNAITALVENRYKGYSKRLPLRPVVLGGDDLTMITRARDAMEFTRNFLSNFEAETRVELAPLLRNHQNQLGSDAQALFSKGLTACAGVAMVKSGFPFHASYHLAEELCAAAKSHRSQTPDKPRSSLLFHRVTTPAILPWEEIVHAELSSIRPNGDVAVEALVGGPWYLEGGNERSVNELAELAALKQLRELPRGALREWLREVQSDQQQADIRWKRMLEVLKDRGGDLTQSLLLGCLKRLGATQSGWRADGTTPIADAMTLMVVEE